MPRLEFRKRAANGCWRSTLRSRDLLEDGCNHRRKTREHLAARLVDGRPAKPVAQQRQTAFNSSLAAFGRSHGCCQCTQEIKPPEGDGAFLLQLRDPLHRFPAVLGLDGLRSLRRRLELLQKRWRADGHRVVPTGGGREWE